MAVLEGEPSAKKHISKTDLTNDPVRICVCAVESVKGFYLQHVLQR